MQLSNFFLDFLFPPTCLSCGKFAEVLCSKCLAQIHEQEQLICPFCLQTSLYGQKHSKCKGNLDGLVAIWSYKGVIQKVIKSVKYRYYWAFFDKIIQLYLLYLQKPKYQRLQKYLEQKPIVIPVPLHKFKQKQRGFNQAEIIGKTLAKYYDLPFSKQILIRIVNTKPQSELSKKERAVNIKNAFFASGKVLQISSKPLKDKQILLVDDVWTTGSTMQTCARILKKLGASKIWALTLAR
ncbi:ComF family protein [Candidatus Beckwithbacteria bacterium]|nr:ComF family protein [Candidatus Beckwithbacteria bacterium]